MRRASQFGKALVAGLGLLMLLAMGINAGADEPTKPPAGEPAAAATPEKEAKPEYPPNAARDALEAACRDAAKESKLVFLKSGYPECGWCRLFDKYHGTPEIRAIVGKYFVVAAIDTVYMPDGEKIFSTYAKPGAPSWVILTPEKKVLIDSYAEKGNVGFPGMPDEKAYYQTALKKVAPKITQEELDVLGQHIDKLTNALLNPAKS